jgi:hypothetical protein
VVAYASVLDSPQLLIPLSMDVQSIFVRKCNPCLEIVKTTSELTYHWVSLSQILSENAVDRSRQTCLYELQEHRTIYVLHSSPFSLAVSCWTTVEPTRGK